MEIYKIIEQVLALCGGISMIVFLTIKFCKQIIEKYIHTQIENSANKELEKIKNDLSRSLSAYEILLNKELEYYQKIDKIYAQLAVDICDIDFYSTDAKEMDTSDRNKYVEEVVLRILQSIKDLKNLNLVFQVYVPIEIFNITGDVYAYLQDNCDLMKDIVLAVFDRKECDVTEIEKFKDKSISLICLANATIRNRLENLSSI